MVLSGPGGGSLGVDERLTEVERLAQGVLGFGLLILLAYSNPLHSKIPHQIASSQLAGPVQTGALILHDGIKAIWPSVRSALEDLNIRGSNEHPDVVETIKAGAEDARKKLEGVVEESRKRLKDVVK